MEVNNYLQFGDEWLDMAAERVTTAPTVRESLKTAAGYLTDLMDALALLRGEDEVEGDYQLLITRELELIDSIPDGDHEGEGAVWEMAREILLLYNRSTSWTENELTQEAKFTSCQFLAPEKTLKEAIKTVFVSILAYHQGWVAGESLN
jgi:hypothetical protein